MRTISSTEFESLISYLDTTAFGYFDGTSFMVSVFVVEEDDVQLFINADDDGRDIYLYDMSDDRDRDAILERVTIADRAQEMYDNLASVFCDDLGTVLADYKVACTTDEDGVTTYVLIY